MEISPGVHLIDTGSVNLYLCEDEDNLVLIDAGMPRKEALVFDLIAQLGRQPADLKSIVITHADLDHVGSLAAIQAKSGAKVYMGAETAVWVQQGKSPQHMPWYAQFILDHFMKYTPVPDACVQIIQDEEMIPVMGGLQALATPGHTLDHFSYFCAQSGVLFAGDALNTRKDQINRTPARITADELAANQSAIRLFGLTPAVFACGHGQPKSDHSSDDLMQTFNQFRQP